MPHIEGHLSHVCIIFRYFQLNVQMNSDANLKAGKMVCAVRFVDDKIHRLINDGMKVATMAKSWWAVVPWVKMQIQKPEAAKLTEKTKAKTTDRKAIHRRHRCIIQNHKVISTAAWQIAWENEYKFPLRFYTVDHLWLWLLRSDLLIFCLTIFFGSRLFCRFDA